MHTFLEIAKWTKKFHPDKYFAKTREIGSIATNCFVRASAYGKSSRPAKMLLLSLLFILFFSSLNAQAAATYYVRAGASGTQNGSEWNNAYSSLPSNLIRGATYYIADGSYSGYIFDDSGTTPITIKKATIADHGTNTGWSDTMGDGQATFGTLDIRVSGIILDGNTRNESNWANESSYGFKINTEIRTSTFDTGGFCPDNVTIKYSSIGGSPSSKADDAIYLGGFHDDCTEWTISNNYLHDVSHYTIIQAVGLANSTIEKNRFHTSEGKEAIRGQIKFAGNTVRWNEFYNACGYGGGAGEGCTAEIAAWGTDGSGLWDNNKIYGNWFWRNRDNNSGGTIVIGGDGVSWLGSPGSNNLIYNNTFAGFSGGWNAGQILINGGTGNTCRNNLWYDTASTTVICNTKSNNVVAGANPFVNYSAANLHLSSGTSAGYSLSSPYNLDMDGNIRDADSTWDVGAFEFDPGGGGGSTEPSSPKNLRVIQ